MKCSRDCMRLLAVTVFAAAAVLTISAFAELPVWIRNIEATSAVEAAFFRMMSLPGGPVSFRRPPRETRPALGELIKVQPKTADLYSLRALEDEQQLDFSAAESDWKSYVENSSDKPSAQFALADFYHRRLRPIDEIKTLSAIAGAPPITTEKLTPTAQQRSWGAFDRIFGIIQDQGLPKEVSIVQYRAWIARYPQEPSLYARFLQFLVAQKEYPAATQLVADYHKQFPNDPIFPVKAKAMVEYRQGSVRQGLAVYEQSFQPLWDPELVKSYFDLLRETQSLRKFLDQARASVNASPEDLNATARLFYYYQQQGKLEVAKQAIADFRLHKETSKSAWTSQELYICARLLEDVHDYPEAARYYYALYNSKGMPDAQEKAVAGLTGLLLTAPETPIRFGSGELSMYRDIATMDQGPGYLNGILSLLLNTTSPASQHSEEEQRAVPYFHRSRAAEMLALLDAKFPNAASRPELHRKLLEFYAGSGESDAVIKEGRQFLSSFPTASQRTAVALLMADAYARKSDTAGEFAIYDSVLQELAAKSLNVPLGAASDGSGYNNDYSAQANNSESADEEGNEGEGAEGTEGKPRKRSTSPAFQVGSAAAPSGHGGPRAPEYARVLERYLARLVEMKQIPQALGVLSREIDHNPDDPGLYERLATFLDQNRLGSQQEEVYRRAIARFPDRSWYDKLARFYLRHRRDSEFAQLTEQAIKSFKGTELEEYFNNVYGASAGMYLALNLHASQRFPHNPVFVHNLLNAYLRRETYNPAAWEALLRQHWFEEATLRGQFFEFLCRSGKLEVELRELHQTAPDARSWESNPAAADFMANANLWRSHFEESAAPLKSLATQYPAEPEIVHTASSVYRSLAYFEPADTAIATKIEDNFLQANTRDTETMARIGDIYSDRDRFSDAAPYWERIPQVSPGQSGGYLEAATIYWDYYDFDNALRLLNRGRERLHNPDLYAYEIGAIYENQRDYAHAIAEYVKGALSASDSQAEARLLQLARRPKLRDLVDQSTANVAPLPNPSMTGVGLRVKVLEAQERKPEIETLLDSIATATTSIEQAEDIENLAQQRSLEKVRQHALEKQAALTTDPVTRLRIRYALVQLYESRKDFQSAEKNVEALYNENPKTLGVVRSTVDFYWRTKNYPRAIGVLLQAAKDSYPDLSQQFTYEAARKSTEAKQYEQARGLLVQLLQGAPCNGEYLAAMADTYAQAGDDAGLRQFYGDKITLFRAVPLPAEARKAQIAALRRGLILALTRLKEYPGAVDQYIELINNFPDDDALVTEAALYALRYQRQQQLVDFYAKTVAQSPRDYHWCMVLARIYTNLENYPAAIDTYAKSLAVRPDRVDLFTARAGLEERLMRFDEAVADYERIYQLAYKDPQWMEKVAEIRARQGKQNEVVAALKTAMIEGRPEKAENYFEVAQRLEKWGMLAVARSFAEQGVKAAGQDLLAEGRYQSGARVYVRIMTRLRQHDQAYSVMQNALQDASATLPVLKEQVARQGITGLTDQQWRDHLRQVRIDTATSGMAAMLHEMGNTVNTYFTPEERLAFAKFAESKCDNMSTTDMESFALPLAQTATLADQEARWRFEVLMRHAGDPRPNYYSGLQAFIDLQNHRGRFTELAGQLEQFAAAVPPLQKNTPILDAAEAYHSAGDASNELRMLSSVSVNYLDGQQQQRLFHLLLKADPQQLVRIASQWRPYDGQQAADFIVAHADPAIAHAMVQGRGQSRDPVWRSSYNALVALHYTERTPEAKNAFLAALGDKTIAERLAHPVDRSQQLAGNIWFYYGSRYGEYLGVTRQSDPEDFLPAVLEQSPATASGYLTLADYYESAGDTQRAIADYNHTLELSPGRADVYDNLALAYFKQGDRAAALAEWKQAFAILLRQVDSSQVPESFWTDFGRTCDQLRTRHLSSELKPDVEAILRAYLRKNGSWRSNALLHPAYIAIGDPASATPWLLDISSAAQDPTAVLVDLADASWIPLPQRAAIYQRILEAKEAAVAKPTGADSGYAQDDLGAWQVRWIKYLIRTKQYSHAADAMAALPKATRDGQANALVPLDLRLAAQLGTLDARIAAYRADPQTMPSSELLRTAARQLFQAGDKQSARKILEFVFVREIDEHQLNAANFLGLAEIRIASGDMPGALDLLRRLVIVVGNPFENLDPAAALLEKTGHNAEAVEFLDQLVKSAPWDASYRLRLAKAKLAAGQDATTAQDALSAVASAPDNPYDLRIKAATTLASRAHSDMGSGELNFLAASSPQTPATADKFYFYEARIRAAQAATDPQTKMDILSHCIIDFPRRDDARIPLFQAAAARQANEYAAAIIDPLTKSQFLRGYGAQTESEDEQIINSEDDEDNSQNVSFAASSRLTRAQQSQLGQLLGEVMVRLGRLPEAVSYYDSARRVESSAAKRKELARKIADLRATLRIEQQNAARRPIFHQDLEQDRVVRPRLLAGAAPAPQADAKGGSKQ